MSCKLSVQYRYGTVLQGNLASDPLSICDFFVLFFRFVTRSVGATTTQTDRRLLWHRMVLYEEFTLTEKLVMVRCFLLFIGAGIPLINFLTQLSQA